MRLVHSRVSLRPLAVTSLSRASAALLALAALAGPPPSWAQSKAAQDELKAAGEAARAAARPGPVSIPVASEATIALPADYVFVPQPEADQFLKALGNGTDPARVGLIFRQGSNSFLVAKYVATGYIKDDEARDWNADKLLDELKEGTEKGNQERASRGIPALEIVRWIQPPSYDATTHKLVWSVELRDKGATDASTNAVNYNTFVLGREGMVSLNLVSAEDSLAKDRSMASDVLASTSFIKGRTYADFNRSTDHVAEFGIAALVAGVAAKKLGLLALGAAFVAKFAKIIGVAVIGAGVALRRWLARR